MSDHRTLEERCIVGARTEGRERPSTYGGTSPLFLEFLPRFGIDVELCETDDHDALEAAVGLGCDLLYLETPTNPTLKVLDLARLIGAGQAAGAAVVVDNTFATPINQRPLGLGADLVLHSATKFLGGHSDAMGGVVCGHRRLLPSARLTTARLKPNRCAAGDPQDSRQTSLRRGLLG